MKRSSSRIESGDAPTLRGWRNLKELEGETKKEKRGKCQAEVSSPMGGLHFEKWE